MMRASPDIIIGQETFVLPYSLGKKKERERKLCGFRFMADVLFLPLFLLLLPRDSEGDCLHPQSELVDEFIDGIDFPPGLEEWQKMITLDDYAKKRIELEDRLTSFLPQQPKFRIHLLGIGEASLALQAFADKSSPLYAREICARADWLRIWYKEERFPWELGWENRRAGYKITLTWLIRTATKLLNRTKELEKEK